MTTEDLLITLEERASSLSDSYDEFSRERRTLFLAERKPADDVIFHHQRKLKELINSVQQEIKFLKTITR
jgi:hypothetical protein